MTKILGASLMPNVKTKQAFQPWHLKYRPQSINDLTGQDSVQKVLTRLITEDSVPQALLLSGPKGTGKTSTARIIAMSLNCEKGVTTTPCGECKNCKAIQNGNSLDVVELDAASHNGVDDIRKLVADAGYAPFSARTRVFIIDEAHQLSNSAQNAFLKTLEEPNNHTKFLLATTEPHKMLETVRSRCLPLRFRPISQSEVAQRLEDIAKKEGVSIDDSCLEAIARSSKGGMRDSIQLLFEVFCHKEGDEPVKVDKVYEVTKELNPTQVEFLLSAVAQGDSYNLVRCCNAIEESALDINKVFDALLTAWTDVMAVVLGANPKQIAKTSILGTENLETLSQKLDLTMLTVGLEKLDQAERRIATSSNSSRWLLATLLSLVNGGE
ncbi:DNA polymerase III gamma subunit [Crocosphaera subtropica ATCC 51142]|uniref:DNA polymerase III subunit gamma/tau n=2 Tax=Crocosphaera TaxID=263510 RepID=B1X2D0_CROS5|nr:DNA polymerase III gamma subunit [Crocosphaera subtropica ATCC 51142]